MYGAEMGTATLARWLVSASERLNEMVDSGWPVDDDAVGLARDLMEGSMELWRRLREERDEHAGLQAEVERLTNDVDDLRELCADLFRYLEPGKSYGWLATAAREMGVDV